MVPFKNYELIMAVVLIASVIFMVVAFVKITLEEDEEKDKNDHTR